MEVTLLPHLALLKISGADAAAFLQGQLTQNALTLGESRALPALYCTREGRVKCNAIFFKNAENFYLLLADDLKEKIVADLKKYILRSKVLLEIENAKIFGIFENHERENLSVENNKIYLNENRIIQIGGDFNLNESLLNKWRFLEIKNGRPWIFKNTSELFTPQMLSFDSFAVDFKKGCYVGQEIIARTHYLGKAKRALFILKSQNLLNPLDFIFNEKKGKIGQVLDSVFYNDFYFAAAVLNAESAPPFLNENGEKIENASH